MKADFVIIGAGSAGCAMAYRLSEDEVNTVIVIEYGGSDMGPLIQMPAALSYPMNMKAYDWGFQSEPEPHLDNRKLATPRGKVLGGSSSINGMVYVRGHAKDYDYWEQSGANGWSYADVLPYFKRMENWRSGGHGGDKSWRGRKGPLHVSRGPRKNPLFKAFVKAGQQAGYETTEDYNGEKQEGFGPMEQTVYKGRRWSAANAYLHSALKRKNCKIVRAFARKVIIEKGKAIGVEVEINGKIQVIFANREVIISASSINSPKLLMLSGIGPAEHLKQHGIKVIADRPGVGQNLQDHLEIYLQIASLKPITLYKYWNFVSKALIGAQWLFTKTGLGASNQFESAAFIRSKAGIEYPDIQYHFLPGAITYDGKVAFKDHGFQVHVGHNKPTSRGHVRAVSVDVKQHPEILFNYLETEQDRQGFRDCVHLTREIMRQPAMDAFRDEVIQPVEEIQTNDQIDAFVRESVDSAYHPSCTCKIGVDSMAVVDPDLRVIGLKKLRIVDSSVFPTVPNGNLNGPTMMVAERGADIIKGVTEPSISVKVYTDSQWQKRQREGTPRRAIVEKG